MKNRRIFSILLLITLALGMNAASGQEVYSSSGRDWKKVQKEKEKGFSTDKLVLGGGIGFNFWSGVLNFRVAPIVGYRITDNFAAGVGFGYDYIKAKEGIEAYNGLTGRYDYYDYKGTTLSPSVWARYKIFNSFFAHAEYEQNFMRFTEYYYDPNTGFSTVASRIAKQQAPALLVGGGIRQPLGERASLNLMLLFDVLKNEHSPYRYQSFILRTGFNIGF